ncbi:MAG: hypothetical protein NZM25_05495 [Leptospiraceae bacterium]|nr:hypothetical protein [Leptospiraceae bacterium]MDW8306500.1 hypothetical protein [Leptospiraceae bacterium]
MPLALLWVLVIISCQSPPKQAMDDYVIGIGESPIYERDISLARDRALLYAKKDAVRKKLGTLIEAKTITESGVWVKGEVLAKTEGLVTDYLILKEIQEQELVKIEIRAKVERQRLQNLVDELLEAWERPVVFAVVEERFEDKPQDPFSNSATHKLAQFFTDKGFAFLTTSKLQKVLLPPISSSTLANLQTQDEIDFDLLIYGNGYCQNRGPVLKSQLLSAQASAELSIFDPYTGFFYAGSTKNAAHAHVDITVACQQAMAEAIGAIGEDLYQQLLKKWEREYSRGRPVVLEIEGVMPYRSFHAFQVELREKIRGVEAVFEKSFGSKSRLLVFYSGKITALLVELLKKNFSIKFTIVSRIGNKLLLRVV